MAVFISKETINRLLRDVRSIIKNPLIEQGIYYSHDDTDMLKGYALIIGPEDTPYFGGYYLFSLDYPIDYPHNPPKVKYYTNYNNVRFNPNLYVCGKVCVSLLNTWSGEQWTSCNTISTVLLTLCTLLCRNPLLNEPGITINHYDIDNYNEIIEYSNINIAVLDILNKKPDIYLPFFDIFYHIMIEHYRKNYNKLLEFIEMKINNKYVEKQVLTTTLYNMNILIDYKSLLVKLEQLRL
jgi:ubiquitin-conjugating enzyme E2 Z